MRASKLGPPGNVGYAGKRPTWEPMEAKAAPLEVMTLSTSRHQENPENYSGEGKDQEEEAANAPSAGRAMSEEERDAEGSAKEDSFPERFGLKVNKSFEPESSLSEDHNQVVTVAEHTTLSHWQLVEEPTTPPAEEGRGEILSVRRPTTAATSHKADRAPTSAFTPVLRTSTEVTTPGQPSKLVTLSPEVSTQVLTTTEVTTVVAMPATDSERTDPTTSRNSADRFPLEESISISWVQPEETTDLPDLQTSTDIVQLTTVASEVRVGATEMESRSAVSESFVVGSRWTPFKNTKSEEKKTLESTNNKDTNNQFGFLVPNWAFGLIPSGM